MKSLALCLCVLAANTLFAAPEVSAPEKNRQQQEKPGDISCSDAEKAKLLQGEIVIRKAANPDGQTSGRTYDALGLITGTVGQVSDVLVDYEKYPQFMPNMETTQIKSTDGNTSVVECKLGLPMGQVKRYRLSLTASREEAEAYITWRKAPWPELKDSETIIETTGFWLLKPFPEKPGCVLAWYHVYTDPGKIPTGFGWIVNILTKGSMPDILRNTDKRVKSLYYK